MYRVAHNSNPPRTTSLRECCFSSSNILFVWFTVAT